jgi:hypothetical protein
MTQTIIYYLYIQSFHNEGLSWQWSYGSWIYHFLFSQCLSPLMLWVRLPLRARCTTLCDKDCQWLAAGQWVFSGSSGFIHLQNWPPRYNWNIVESDIKHHNPNPPPVTVWNQTHWKCHFHWFIKKHPIRKSYPINIAFW